MSINLFSAYKNFCEDMAQRFVQRPKYKDIKRDFMHTPEEKNRAIAVTAVASLAIALIVVVALLLLSHGAPLGLISIAFITYNAICLARLFGPTLAYNILDELKKAEASKRADEFRQSIEMSNFAA